MHTTIRNSLILIALSLISACTKQPPKAITQPKIQYKSYTLKTSIIHTLQIPTASFTITPAVSPKLDSLENFVQKHNALGAINGGFFDPKNGKSTSHIIVQAQQVADPRQNDRLINNPNLTPYLPKILNRSEFRRYRCGNTWRYDITLHNAPTPSNCQFVDALGGGPGLLPLNLVEEGFLAVANGQTIRDALGSSQANARSAVAIKDNNIIFVMAAQKLNPNSGISLPALADFLKTLGAQKALNLDGGSSSALYYNDKIISGKVDDQGNSSQRPIKSVLLIQAETQ
ncbi:MAG: phosphodiester glycosidase family protein [Coleofasciculaceae cyanobacterium]